MNKLRSVVSKKKQRYQKEGFDLDLTYISDRVISMGFPSTGAESLYRNPLEEVQSFFQSKHDDHYKIYNLCAEKNYDPSVFSNRVARFPFEDHNAPHFSLVLDFCEDASRYLMEDKRNTCAVHCKAGKGRTGTMVSALMLYLNAASSASEATELFGRIRCNDSKGVTIPSQRRYVTYFEECVVRKGMRFPVKDAKVVLKAVHMSSVPHFDRDEGSDPYFIIQQPIYNREDLDNYHMEKLYDYSQNEKVKHFKKGEEVWLKNINIEVSGDFRITFYDMDKVGKDDKMFVCWLNTNFLHLHQPYNTSSPNSIPHKKMLGPNDIVVRVPKVELDKAVKDKKHQAFDADFFIDLIFEVKESTVYSEPRKFVYETPEIGKALFGEIQQYAKTEASSKEKEKARKLYEQGREFFSIKQYANAVTCFSNAILIDGAFEEAYMSRGLANMNLKRFGEAIYDFTSVLNILSKGTTSLGEELPIQDSIMITLRAYHSRVFRLHYDYTNFIKYMDPLSHSIHAKLREGKISGVKYEQYLFEMFQAFCNKAIAIGKIVEEYPNKDAQIFNDLSKAIEYIEKMSDPAASTEAQNFAQVYLSRAQRQTDKEAAIDDYLKCLLYDKSNKKANKQLAVLLYEQKNYRRAILFFNKLIKDDPQNSKTITNRAICYMKLEQYDKAIEDFMLAQSISPENMTLYVQCARCFRKKHEQLSHEGTSQIPPSEIDECERQYSTVIDHIVKQKKKAIDSAASPSSSSTSPSTPSSSSVVRDDDLKTLYFERGMNRILAKRFDNAVLDFSLCLELDPNHVLALYNRAYTRQKHFKQYDRAISDYEHVLSLNSGDLRARLEKGCCLYYLKKDQEAMMEWQMVLKKDPNNEAAKIYLAQLMK
ncbi:hypothetical protein C9374_011299 [Naegleria lovaniensis]|uniref:Phosphatidylinositol-3,4,5-trisphosphate 3-phosphatase n=1 Tax=Naegleria lovaniensis TaxID=51637 RepID=A0AA88KRC9_NAELO|nr:uncharacterized protein C9374_011299 [Naegleria lovaniensis]KAG2392574.1 hypothetical protein C9374_011299 [Naegleria lovaniensis]